MSSVVKRVRTFTLRSKGYLKNVEARAEYNNISCKRSVTIVIVVFVTFIRYNVK